MARKPILPTTTILVDGSKYVYKVLNFKFLLQLRFSKFVHVKLFRKFKFFIIKNHIYFWLYLKTNSEKQFF